MTADSRPVRSGSVLVGALRRPYPVTMPMVALMALVPFYIFISGFNRGRPQHFPETALDRVLPLQPGWALVYGALYAFLILLPVMVIREEALIRRTFQTYLAVW